jgi:hypothetical protein
MSTSHQVEGAQQSSEEEEVERENHHGSSNVKMNEHNTDREHNGDVDKSDHFRQRNEIIFIGINLCLLFLSFGVLLYLLSYSKDECPTL